MSFLKTEPLPERIDTEDAWLSLEVSPVLAHDTARSIEQCKDLSARPNDSGKECPPAIKESIFIGVPLNVTLLFSREHDMAAAEPFMYGMKRRLEVGFSPDVGSVAMASAHSSSLGTFSWR